MILYSTFLELNLIFLLFFLSFLVKKNNKLNEEKIKLLNLNNNLSKLEREFQEVNSAFLKKKDQILDLKIKNTELEISLKKELEDKEREIKIFKNAEEKLVNVFKILSFDALKENSNNFLNLAKEVIDIKLKEANNNFKKEQITINEIVIPIKEKLGKFDNEIQKLEKNRLKSYEGLKEQINILMNQTSNLANSLRKPYFKGKWGEIQLKRVVEMAGMIEYCDFFIHPSIIDKNEDNLLRPDLIIKMPSGKQIVVDAKMPLDSYIDAISQNDLKIQKEKLKKHSLNIKKHINDLCKKEYWNQFENTPEFVILFLTSEGIFSAALEYEPGLIEFGVKKKVIIATPITLIALLRTIAFGWKQELITKNAMEISKVGHILYERICTMGENFDNLRRSLKNTIDNYNKTAASLETRVFPAARKFNKLGIHNKNKELSKANKIELLPRNIHFEELR